MEKLSCCKVLVVGAGGIGCELLKNLVMWHFTNITVVDLDTIDVSNLNRQFLFRKEHVGKSKALTAKESVLVFNPNVTIDARHDDIMSDKYDVEFFKSFDVVLNALDNRTARNYVNRMCLKANTPLVESGTTGYRGQVQVIIKDKTACYECYPKPAQKQFPACTIRNTPSEPIHCVVWAKFLFKLAPTDTSLTIVNDSHGSQCVNARYQISFVIAIQTKKGGLIIDNQRWIGDGVIIFQIWRNRFNYPHISQLFGEPDVDEDVVPDQNDPELADVATENGDSNHSAKINVRLAWIGGGQCNAALLLKILFCDNINSLLSMKSLWTKDNRVKPVVLEQSCIDADATEAAQYISTVTGGVRDQDSLSLMAWCQILKKSALELASKINGDTESLHWDKDDVVAMDFVAAAANIRMSLFHIVPMKNRFDIKSMAGNIIPAIATTNALIAGITVLQAYKILSGRADACLDVMVSDFVSGRGKIVQAAEPMPPVKDCYVCASKHELTLFCKTSDCVTLKMLKKEIFEEKLQMLAPNVGIMNKTCVLIDGGDEDEDEEYLGKTLDKFELADGTVLRCSDFLNDDRSGFNVTVKFFEGLGTNYELVGDIDGVLTNNGVLPEESVVVMEGEDGRSEVALNRKRKTDDTGDESTPKMLKTDSEVVNDDDDDDDLIFVC